MGADDAAVVSTSPLEIRLVRETDAAPLARFFERLRAAGLEKWFHPHPLDELGASTIASSRSRDLYYVVTVESRVIAYGMLRGWDEGYAVPSLGIAVDPEIQGRGIGRMFMAFLHAAATARGSRQVRLTVDDENDRALHLYEDLGYSLVRAADGRWVGFLELEA